MIVTWEVDKEGNPTGFIGLYQTDDDFKKAVLPKIADEHNMRAGDVQEFKVSFMPAAVSIVR